ncbi:MAG: DNA ligase [Myxococcota bacterium]
MDDLEDGDSVEVKGSGATPYVLRNDGGVYSCTCPAWRHQSAPIDKRTCKHLKRLRGEAAEIERLGSYTPPPRAASAEADPGKAPPVLLAERWPESHDPTGWWVSEKLDGVRAYWDGTQFLSRLGNRFVAPAWFVAGLPDHPLDGELWAGRKRFQDTVSTVRRVDGGDRWKELAFVVFDAPAHDAPFEARLEHVAAALGAHTPYARPHPHAPCDGIEHLRDELLRVEQLGGEGLMLRKPGSRYEVGRSSTLLKVKTFFDAEAVVIGHEPGAGRHKGRLGSLWVENADGVRFNVGTGLSDAERGDPPPVGATVTYRYQELSRDGVPRFPSYVGLRIDAPAIRPRAPAPAAEVRTAGVAPAVTGAGMERRRFEFTEDGSSKFWEVEQSGPTFTTTWGRIGTDGQSKTKDAGSDAAAAREVAKLVAEKVGKGYAEVGGASLATDEGDDDESLELDDEVDAVQALAREVRPLLSKVKARLRADFPSGLPLDALHDLGLDESEVDELVDFVATIGEVDQLFARLAGR